MQAKAGNSESKRKVKGKKKKLLLNSNNNYSNNIRSLPWAAKGQERAEFSS